MKGWPVIVIAIIGGFLCIYAKGLMHVLRQVSGIAKTYSYNPETELNRLTYKFRDESKKEKRQEKFKPLREKPPEDE